MTFIKKSTRQKKKKKPNYITQQAEAEHLNPGRHQLCSQHAKDSFRKKGMKTKRGYLMRPCSSNMARNMPQNPVFVNAEESGQGSHPCLMTRKVACSLPEPSSLHVSNMSSRKNNPLAWTDKSTSLNNPIASQIH